MPRLLIQRLLRALALLATIAVMFVVATLAAFAETPILTAPEASGRVASGDLVLLDIRTPEEWKETGLADGAWPVSMHTPDFPKQLQEILTRFSPDQIGLICATGGRSSYVTKVLEQNGIHGVLDVSEGMFGNGNADGWIARGLPVIAIEEATERFKAAKETWE